MMQVSFYVGVLGYTLEGYPDPPKGREEFEALSLALIFAI